MPGKDDEDFAGLSVIGSREAIDVTREILDSVFESEHWGDAREAIAVAQVHATLAVAETLRELIDVLANKE